MSPFNLTPLILFLPICLVCLFLAFSSVNQLVRLERTEFREAWGNDGLPRGFTWHGLHYRPDLATMMCFWQWLFVTPSWAKHSHQALSLLWRLRLTTLVWNIGLIFLFYAVIAK